jgi:predicted TIM-barrel fold metal-dependent hydrolase
MDYARLADVPIIDGHVHFSHIKWTDQIVELFERVPLLGANFVSTPRMQTINHNPALIHLKALYPDRAYLSGGLDFVQVMADREHMSDILAAQIRTLKAIGFDGLKLIEGKPTARRRMNVPLDAPEYEGMWSALEALETPAIYHVADPEEFWDADRLPERARSRGQFYGDGTYPTKEALYAEVDHVLDRHPGLKIIFAHFYFLSADLERAGDFLDAHPNVCFDLTPGREMYNHFTRNHDATRAFFFRYQDQLVYGTDTTTWAIERGGVDDPVGRAWVVRTFLETDGMFTPPPQIPHWVDASLEGFHGIALPRDVLTKIYYANFRRLYGQAPAPLNVDAAIAELERMAEVIDVRAEDGTDNQARTVAKELMEGLASL